MPTIYLSWEYIFGENQAILSYLFLLPEEDRSFPKLVPLLKFQHFRSSSSYDCQNPWEWQGCELLEILSLDMTSVSF